MQEPITRATFRKIFVVDSHTEGEPTRVIMDGGPDLGRGTLAQNRIGSTLKWVCPVTVSGANGTQAYPFPRVSLAVAAVQGGPGEGVVRVKTGTYADTVFQGGPVTFANGCTIVPDGGPIVIQ